MYLGTILWSDKWVLTEKLELASLRLPLFRIQNYCIVSCLLVPLLSICLTEDYISFSYLIYSGWHRTTLPHLQHYIPGILSNGRDKSTSEVVCNAYYCGQSMQLQWVDILVQVLILLFEFSSEQTAVLIHRSFSSILFLPLSSLMTFSSLYFTLGKIILMSFLKQFQIWWKPPATAFLILKGNLHLWHSHRSPNSRK